LLIDCATFVGDLLLSAKGMSLLVRKECGIYRRAMFRVNPVRTLRCRNSKVIVTNCWVRCIVLLCTVSRSGMLSVTYVHQFCYWDCWITCRFI